MTGALATPIFHMSFPVCDLSGSIEFYTQTLGGVVGRHEEGWADIALFGAQLTLQHIPGDVLNPMPRSRHFGATLGWEAWEELVAKLAEFVEPPRVECPGTDREQAKAMIADPSGNLIEIKAYRNAGAVLGQFLVGEVE